MALNQWLSLRATRFQSIRMSLCSPFEEVPKDLGLPIRYQAAADRAFHKAHSELLKVQKERKNSEIGFVWEKAEEPSEEPAIGLQPPPPPPPMPIRNR
jgi:hypothetical protein